MKIQSIAFCSSDDDQMLYQNFQNIIFWFLYNFSSFHSTSCSSQILLEMGVGVSIFTKIMVVSMFLIYFVMILHFYLIFLLGVRNICLSVIRLLANTIFLH